MDRMKVPLKSIERAESAESLNKSLRLPVLAQLSGHIEVVLWCFQNLLCIFDITSPALLCQVSAVAQTSLCSFFHFHIVFIKNT